MDASQGIERRVERVVFETDRYMVVGDVTLPPAQGYQSRLSDSLNRSELNFIPLVDVEITPLDGGPTQRKAFAVLARAHVRLAFPLEEAPS